MRRYDVDINNNAELEHAFSPQKRTSWLLHFEPGQKWQNDRLLWPKESYGRAVKMLKKGSLSLSLYLLILTIYLDINYIYVLSYILLVHIPHFCNPK